MIKTFGQITGNNIEHSTHSRCSTANIAQILSTLREALFAFCPQCEQIKLLCWLLVSECKRQLSAVHYVVPLIHTIAGVFVINRHPLGDESSSNPATSRPLDEYRING